MYLSRVSRARESDISRPVKRVVDAPSGLEGEGFPVKRAFSLLSIESIDPFIMMDQMGFSTQMTGGIFGYHGTGVGKTCSAIDCIENFLTTQVGFSPSYAEYNSDGMGPPEREKAGLGFDLGFVVNINFVKILFSVGYLNNNIRCEDGEKVIDDNGFFSLGFQIG